MGMVLFFCFQSTDKVASGMQGGGGNAARNLKTENKEDDKYRKEEVKKKGDAALVVPHFPFQSCSSLL